MTYTVFSGCSFTAGAGFLLEKQEHNLWVNLLHQKLFSDTDLLNVGKNGRSNAGIFQDTVSALVSYPVKYAIVEWTSYPRFEIEPDFELSSTRRLFSKYNSPIGEFKTKSINYSGSYLDSLRTHYMTLIHDCHEILRIIEYINAILKLAQLTKTQVFFVNGLCHWDIGFFDKKTNCLPGQYTKYTQDLLCTSDRNKEESFLLYDKMHQNFNNAGGINQLLWLNLYEPMKNLRIDFNSDGHHPGIESNKLFFDLFSKELSIRLV